MSDELNKAITYFNANNLSGAKKSLKKVKKNSFAKKKLEYGILLKEKKYKQSIFLGKQLLLDTKEPKVIVEIANSLARCYFSLNDVENAVYYFEMSIAQDDSINNGASIIYLLKLYALKEHFVNIEKLAPKALAWEKYSSDAQLVLLESASKMGSKALVEERIKKIFLDFDVLEEEQFLQVINYLHSLRRHDLQEIACERFEKRFNTVLVSNKVEFLLKQNKLDEALESLTFEPENIVGQQYLLGNILQQKCDYSGAFEAWEKAGKIETTQNLRIKEYVSYTQQIFNEYRSMIPKFLENSDALKGDEGRKNVFIFGFPRSGTTLLDNVLDTQDGLLVLSERSILEKVAIDARKMGTKHRKDVSNLSKDELNILRHKYLNIIVDEQGFKLPESGIIVEKNPHYSHRLPLIKTLFPQSKLIVSIRHPLDVCLSCLQQNFELNTYNANLLTFKDIVNHYVAVFKLLERYEVELGIEVLYVRYEDLVVDLATEMEKVFNYIGFVPNNNYLDFHKHAANKYVTSASSGQTNKPLYQSSKYKWKKYKEKLSPYIEQLRYFIDKFGYDVD